MSSATEFRVAIGNPRRAGTWRLPVVKPADDRHGGSDVFRVAPLTGRASRLPWRGSYRAGWSLLSELAGGELADDVEVAEVAGVLLGQVEQDPLKRCRPGSVPPVARLADVSKVTGLHGGPVACRLSAQR